MRIFFGRELLVLNMAQVFHKKQEELSDKRFRATVGVSFPSAKSAIFDKISTVA